MMKKILILVAIVLSLSVWWLTGACDQLIYNGQEVESTTKIVFMLGISILMLFGIVLIPTLIGIFGICLLIGFLALGLFLYGITIPFILVLILPILVVWGLFTCIKSVACKNI